MMPRVIFGFQSAFSLWMLVDAARRGAAYYWYPIILFPFGEVVYFLTVKIHDPEFLWLKTGFQRLTQKKISIEQLRYRCENSPSHDNQVALAEALHDRREFREASELFEKALQSHGESAEVLFGLAASQMGREDFESAAENLRALLRLEPTHHECQGWTMLADCLHRTGRTDEAVELLSQLTRQNPRLSHRLHYAHYLRLVDRRDESRGQLKKGLLEHQNAPRFLRRRQGGLARQAKKMLRQLG